MRVVKIKNVDEMDDAQGAIATAYSFRMRLKK